MQEQIINFETAQLAYNKGLKSKYEKGYKRPISPTEYAYNESTKELLFDDEGFTAGEDDEDKEDLIFLAPTQSLLQKWLREIHNIDIDVTRDSEVHYNDEIRWIAIVSDWKDIKIFNSSIADIRHPNHLHFIENKSYEEALEIGLQGALKLIK